MVVVVVVAGGGGYGGVWGWGVGDSCEFSVGVCLTMTYSSDTGLYYPPSPPEGTSY